MEHCVEIVQRIVAQNLSDRRSVFQLGYNLGRLSELTGLGREPFWDRWKLAISDWDHDTLSRLARDLPLVVHGTKADPDRIESSPGIETR